MNARRRNLHVVIADVGGGVDETHVSLCIYGDDLDPDEISRLLRCVPSHAHKKGDLSVQARSPRTTGAWQLREQAQAPVDAGELLNRLMTKLPPAEAPVWKELSARFEVRISFALFVAAWSRGFMLSPPIVEWLAKTQATVGFSIYAEEAE